MPSTIIFAGVVAVLRGQEPPELEHYAPAKITHPEHSSSTYRYCTNFAVTGHDLQASRFSAALEGLGDSILVVGDPTTLKVHLHTDKPGLATALFDGVGEVSHLDVADMRAQVAERDQRLAMADVTNGGAPTNGEALTNGAASVNGGGWANGARGTTDGSGVRGAGAPDGQGGPRRPRCGALAVVNGDGLARLYRELDVHTIDGGPTLNPSTYELLAGIHEVPAEEVVVLPGSANVVMAAERAAELSDKQVLVVPSLSQQAGLAAAVALQGDRGVQENARVMEEALGALRTGSVAQAARADAQGRFEQGDAVGFVEEQMIAWGEPRETLLAVLRALAADAELISVLAGVGAPLELSELEGIMDSHVELELRDGGQPAYWWLLAAE